jgi:hypothetical protein
MAIAITAILACVFTFTGRSTVTGIAPAITIGTTQAITTGTATIGTSIVMATWTFTETGIGTITAAAGMAIATSAHAAEEARPSEHSSGC